MAEEKKPKIDLKARLGKTQVGMGGVHQGIPVPQGGSVPPPMGGSVPPPLGSVPPPGVPVGVPKPPFSSPGAAPDPFRTMSSAPAARAVLAQPTTIKVEIDDESLQAARRKEGKKAVVYALLAAFVGGGLGYAFGGRSASSRGAELALQGAQELIVDIDKSQAKIKELNDKIGSAIKDLKDKKFPEQFATDLGGLSIPFGADKLAGRNIGRFDPRVLQGLFRYTNDIEALNERKDALKNLFSGQKAAIVDALASAGNPKVGYGVVVQKSPAHGPVGVLAKLNGKDTFAYKEAKWPDKFNILADGKPLEVERYAAGDIVSSDKKTIVVPLDPDSVAGNFPNDILMRITAELAKTGGVLAGRSGGGVEEDEAGIIKKGDQLLTDLKKLGQ